MKSTVFARKEDYKDARWCVVDAEGQVLGKLAVQIANRLRGKDKPTFTPHVDTGDGVIVINASKIKLSGKKLADKIYYNHTGYLGHLRSATASQMMEKNPEKIIELAVSGMLPKNKLRKDFLKKLKVYPGAEHPHTAQQPVKLEVK